MAPNLQTPDAPSTDRADTTPHPDAELIELERALKLAPDAARQASKAYEDADEAADAEMPECPVKITYRDRRRRGEKLDRPMTRDDIDRIHDNNRLFYGEAKAGELREWRLGLLEKHEAECEAIRQRHNLPALIAALGRLAGAGAP